MSLDDSRPRNFKPKSKAMREWKEKYYDDELSLTGMTPNELNENMEVKPSLPKSNLKHITMNKLFVAAAFLGSILMVLEYSWGPDGCEDSTIFLAVGKILLFMSFFWIVVNVLILFESISKDDFDSGVVIRWGFLHALCWFVAAMIASDALLCGFSFLQ